MAANHSLGLIYERMGDVSTAALYHERHRELAALEGDEEQVACAELVKVYSKFAEDKEADMDFTGAIDFWKKSLEAAKSSCDRKAQGNACYRLGMAWVQLGEAMRAINYLEQYEATSKEMDDLEGMGHACAALAGAYQALGNDEQAQSYLQQHLDTATRTQNPRAEAEACINLGSLRSRRREYEIASKAFTQNYSLSRQICSQGGCTTAQVDAARVLVGLSQGNEMLQQYMSAVTGDLKAVLEWRLNRVPPQKT
ncbi:unnamed protein product [Chrysoparadoxa australica]